MYKTLIRRALIAIASRTDNAVIIADKLTIKNGRLVPEGDHVLIQNIEVAP